MPIASSPIASTALAGSFGSYPAAGSATYRSEVSKGFAVRERLGRATLFWPGVFAAGVAVNDAYLTFLPPTQPTIPVDIEEAPRLITNNFGDGYQQTIGDGPNIAPLSVSLSFTDLTQIQMNGILSFMAANVGRPFLYLLPYASTPRIWTGGGVKVMNQGAWFDLTVTLTERFDAGL